MTIYTSITPIFARLSRYARKPIRIAIILISINGYLALPRWGPPSFAIDIAALDDVEAIGRSADYGAPGKSRLSPDAQRQMILCKYSGDGEETSEIILIPCSGLSDRP